MFDEVGVIDRILGIIVGAILGALAGTMPGLWEQSVSHDFPGWGLFVIGMVPASLIGAALGFMSGAKSVFVGFWRDYKGAFRKKH